MSIILAATGANPADFDVQNANAGSFKEWLSVCQVGDDMFGVAVKPDDTVVLVRIEAFGATITEEAVHDANMDITEFKGIESDGNFIFYTFGNTNIYRVDPAAGPVLSGSWTAVTGFSFIRNTYVFNGFVYISDNNGIFRVPDISEFDTASEYLTAYGRAFATLIGEIYDIRLTGGSTIDVLGRSRRITSIDEGVSFQSQSAITFPNSVVFPDENLKTNATSADWVITAERTVSGDGTLHYRARLATGGGYTAYAVTGLGRIRCLGYNALENRFYMATDLLGVVKMWYATDPSALANWTEDTRTNAPDEATEIPDFIFQFEDTVPV